MTSIPGFEGGLLRITGGEARGRLIKAPEGLSIRPTGSKVRQAFFNILSNKLNGCRFLDLCAGTGLMGIEAMSRGASSLIAVEEDRPSAKAIESNLKRIGYEGEVICADVKRALPILEPEAFDIIYADPPYKSELVKNLPGLIERYGLLAPDGFLVIEHLKSIEVDVPDLPLKAMESNRRLRRVDTRNYGITSISFFHYDPAVP